MNEQATSEVDMLEVYGLANRIMALIVTKDIATVGMTFAMILGRAESHRKPFPQPTELGLLMMNEIEKWSEPLHEAKGGVSAAALIAGRAT